MERIPTLGEVYRQWELNPEFAALSYEEQKEAKIAAAQKIWGQNPEFAALSTSGKQEAFNTILSTHKPVLKNPEAQKVADTIFQQAEAGELTKEEWAATMANKGLFNTSVIAHVVARPAAKLADALLGWTGTDRWKWNDLVVSNTGTDGDKVEAHINTLLTRKATEWKAAAPMTGGTMEGNNPLSVASAGRSGNLLGSTIGFVGDFLVFHGGWEKATGETVRQAGTAIALGNKGKLATWLGKVALPSAVSGTSSGAFGVFKEQFLATINDDDQKQQDSFAKIAKTFGSYAVLDYALNLAGGTLRHAKLFSRFGKSANAKARFYSPEDIDRAINIATEGELPAEIISQYDPITLRYIRGMAEAKTIGLKVGDDIRLRPYDSLVFEANSAGMVVHRDPTSGTFALFSTGKEGDIIFEELPDILTAKRKVSAGLLARANSMTEGKEDFIRLHRNTLQYALSEKTLDASLDPFKVKGVIDPSVTKGLKKPPKGFTSPVNRPFIGANEVDSYSKLYNTQGGFAAVIRTDVPEDILTRVSKGESMFETNLPVTVDYAEGGQKAFVMLRNPAPLKAYEEATTLAQKAIAKGSSYSEDTLRNMYLMEAGFDGVVLNRAKVQAFYPDKIKLVADQFDPMTGKIGLPSTAKPVTDSIDIQGAASRKFKATVSGKAFTENEALVKQVTATFHGDLQANDVQNFSRLILADAGVKGDDIIIKLSKGVDSTDSVKGSMAYTTFKDGKATIEIPQTITTLKAQKKFVTELFDELNSVAETIGGSAVKINAPKMSGKFLAQFTSPFGSAADTEKWLRSTVTEGLRGKFNKTASGYLIELPGRTPIQARTVAELTDKIAAETMDIGSLRFHLAKKGYTVSQTGTAKEGYLYTVRGKSLAEPVTGTSVNEVLDNLNYRPDKLSDVLAPKLASIDSSRVTIEFQEGVAIGPKKQLKQLFSKFEDTNHVAKSRKIASFEEGDVLVTPSGSYEVHMPEFGIIESFDTPKAARKFVTGQWKTQEAIQAIADRKGLSIFTDDGVRKITDGKTTYLAKTDTDIYKVFKEYPDSTGGPDLLNGLDPDSLSAVDSVLHKFDLTQIPPQETSPLKLMADIAENTDDIVPMSFHGEIKALSSNMDYFAQSTLPKMGMDDVLRDYRQLEVTYKAAMVDIQNTDDALRAVLQNTGKKVIPLDRRKALFYHMGSQTPEETLDAFNKYGELSSDEEVIAQNLRKLIDGLGRKFNVDPDLMLRNYMPRIKNYALSHMDSLNDMATSEELINAAFKSGGDSVPPAKLKAFFKNMRHSDVLAFAVEDDPIKALQHYSRVGHRQLHMGMQWEKLSKDLIDHKASAGVVARFNRYRDLLMGRSTTSGAEAASRLGAALGKKLGIQNGQDLMNAYFTVNYLSNMAFRPWLAVRNTTQVWTTLAPRFGNHWVDQSIRMVNELDETGYEYLRKIGVIFDAPPITNDIMDIDTALGKVTRKGLNMFKRSDDVTRAVAYYTGVARYDFALEKMKRGTISSIDDFIKEAGINKMDDNTISQISRLVREGSQDSIDAARASFGQRIVSETMFEYRSAQSPMLFTGSFWGKIFGQYGTYSAGYRANIMRGLTQGSFSDKAAFTARFLGNQAALYGAFRAVGINAKNFIPGSPALFGGGPQFEVGIALAESFSSDYRGQQARAKLMRKFSPVYYTATGGLRPNVPEMLPGSLQIRYAQKSLEYLRQGDPWRAFLAATTTPVVDPE